MTDKPRPTICLNMIVRDEAHVICETLGSVSPHIDHWVIVDTGSTDATIETVRRFMADEGVPGEIVERRWRNFGHNRTEALEACRGRADYIWVIDADDLVVGDLDLTELRADSYLLRYGTDFRYWRKQIFRDGLRWRYRGVVHEYPVCLDPASEARLPGDYHIESRRLGSRNLAIDKYARDVELLRESVEQESANLARSVFYLAQSHYDAGEYQQALECYTRRAEMGGWEEEVFFSRLRRAACLQHLGAPWEQVLTAYLEAWESRPTRAEPLYEIARHYRLEESFDLAYLFARRAAQIPYPDDDMLFVSADVYEWRAEDELSMAAYYIGRHQESFDVCSALLDRDTLPESERPRVLQNRAFSVPMLADHVVMYPGEIVAACSRRAGADADVTLTITSCRRLTLFERSVNSFLNCCTDLERIGRWICVDNGSSDADRARMRELYPFFEFVYTDPATERHPHSLDRLRELVATPFWLHLEDDWEFFWRGPYIERALAILDDDRAIAQVAFNYNYAETADQRIIGGEPRRTAIEGLRYRVHEYIPQDSSEWERHWESLAPGDLTNAYWPHFTLHPSLMRTEAIRSVGPFAAAEGSFTSEHVAFERDFARRYTTMGLRTAFLDATHCVHIGRLNGPGGKEGTLSAYELVNDGEAQAAGDLDVAVINLSRRPDRWESFRARMLAAAGPEFEARCRRVTAVDGHDLVETPEIKHLFRGNDFAMRRGIVACALSHISIWRQLTARGDDALAVVFEDDAEPCEGFDRRLATVVGQLDPECDIVFLGCSREEPAPERSEEPVTPMRWEGYIGGLFAYLISGRGARRLLELADRDGIQNGIDTFIGVKRSELRVLECDPPLATARLVFAGADGDSDIQHDFTAVGARPRRPLASLVPELAVAEMRLDVRPPWPCSAISIASADDGFLAIARTRAQAGDGETLNYLLSLSEALELRDVEFLQPNANEKWYDGCRLVRVGADWVVTAIECAPDAAPRPVLLRLQGATIAAVEPLAGQPSGPPAPFLAGDKLRLAGSWSPSLVPASAGIPLRDGWLFAAHDREAMAHRLVLIGGDDAPQAASPAFSITGADDEGCWGLAQRNGDLVISFGLERGVAGLAVLPSGKALGMLEPCP